MSEGNGFEKVDVSPAQGKEPSDITLVITMSREHGLSIQGPGDGKFYDEMMCFYLLEKAKDHIKMSNALTAKQEKPIITGAGRQRGLFRGK